MITPRATPLVVLNVPTPIVVNGIGTLPAYVASSDSSMVLLEGLAHIHAIADPNPIWNPATSGWSVPPPPTVAPLNGRWTVDSLPAPPAGGYYWLGDPSPYDGTEGSPAATNQWAPDGSTPNAPSWRSFFPYKPSVRALNSYLPNGELIVHPKGVHFNSQFVEHMWADWGVARRQPFTWVIAAMIVDYPSPGYLHHILDAGRDPDAVGFPRLSASDCYTPRTIRDGLNYRNLLGVNSNREIATASPPSPPGQQINGRFDAHTRPTMFWTIFDGPTSYVGAYGPGQRRIQKGAVNNGAAQLHQYYVLGRAQNQISQLAASHILVFEMRTWPAVLTLAELDAQYAQLSATFQFDRYRSV